MEEPDKDNTQTTKDTELEHSENVTSRQISEPPAQLLPDKPSYGSGGVMVLQWLTYAFWFWCAVSVSWLASVVTEYFIRVGHGNSGYDNWSSALAYPLASVVIMFVIALVTDLLYTKHEPAKKTGGANVTMLLHVVPFVLIGIAAIVAVVFALINMMLNSNPLVSADGPLQIMLVAIVVAVLVGLAAVRAFFGHEKKVRIIVWICFGVMALGFMAAGIAGPAANAMRTKDDRLVEQALPNLVNDIRDYTSQNDKLPASLSDVSHGAYSDGGMVQAALDKKLITYKPNTIKASDSRSYPDDDSSTSGVSLYDFYNNSSKERFYYQLCATYTNEKKSRYNYQYDSSSEGVTYTNGTSAGVVSDYRSAYMASVVSHPAGTVCYNLYAEGKYKDDY